MMQAIQTPWKIWNALESLFCLPFVRVQFAVNGIAWGRNWKFYGLPILQKHRQSEMKFGDGLQLRSSLRSNPLGPNHAVFLTTWRAGAVLEIGSHFGMTGGIICAAERVSIGNHVIVGANSSILDTDFHPLDPALRQADTRAGRAAPVVIEDEVFIGMNSIILKGVTIGRGSVIGAGSVVSKSIPAGSIAAGNPAQIIGQLSAKP